MKKYMSISEFAAEVGVSTTTLRNWERDKKLIPHHRTAGNQRVYSADQVDYVINGTGTHGAMTIENRSMDEKEMMRRVEEYYKRLCQKPSEDRIRLIKGHARDDLYIFSYADNSVTDGAGNRIMLQETPDGVQDVLVEDYLDDAFEAVQHEAMLIKIGFLDDKTRINKSRLIRME
ncbi:MAG: MerR family DNA-binding transcriptional regulator [Eubacterium sp.]|nr:MerR family DNA-binding transcriptional regulator [Eubacterium sp.]